MSKYDNKPLEQELDENVTQAAARFALVGLKFVARGGDLDQARAKIREAASVSDTAANHAHEASVLITSKALAFFEVNLAEAQAEAKAYQKQVEAEEAARDEEARVEEQAKEIIAQIKVLACEIQWPYVYCDSMKSQNQIGRRIERLRKLGVCGRPWFDPESDEMSVFKLTSISNKYML